ncbi:xylulokinase [Aeromicrobium chenweiae]|uniref:Xylulose kinase n=1 Tax=Aeromicrobium chenweiae TaxID=2079793 RepID=A0A2S0WLG7_9ACTN|nr:xylulokinase [Aeromicrobium chenweiae]AWB92157.1 xylulokinase [Aeromicrobium chenweiae]TGN33011.1 xylulokinase [Aeromicrobium chenweiae]
MASDLVLGVDSSTQSTKAVLVDAATGEVVAQQSAKHPNGTSVDPRAWLEAFDRATDGLLPRASAMAVGGQQHGMVALDAAGEPVFDAILWNDTRSAREARDLIDELGGPDACADTVGSVLVASFTSTKLRWLRDHEPDAAKRTHEVLLPHDYVSRHVTGGEAFTDRGDASGTGYFSPADNAWRPDLAEAALGHPVSLPRIAAPSEVAHRTASGLVVGAGTGDNMAAALALDVQPGDVIVSIGTSGVASSISDTRIADGSGSVTGFADATGRFLPMATTMNAARILDLQCRLLGVDHDELGRLALMAPSGANGLTLLPYYDGERTPNRPDATGTWSGLTSSTTREDIARAAFEALLCSLADGVDLLTGMTGVPAQRILLVGGAAGNPAVHALAPAIFGAPVTVPAPDEYVALGAARQAAWALSGSTEPPTWAAATAETHTAEPTPLVREAYARLRDRTADWS